MPPTTVTVIARSRSGRTVYAAGAALGLRPVTFTDPPEVTLRDLWAQRSALAVTWPAAWVAPDGSLPGAAQAAEAAAFLQTLAAEPAPVEQPPVAAPDEPEKPDDAPDVAVVVAAPPTPSPVAPERNPFEVPLEPTWVRAPAPAPAEDAPKKAKPAPAAYADREGAAVASAMMDRLKASMKAAGVKASPAPAVRGLGPGMTLEWLLDTLAEEGAADMRLSRTQRAMVRATDGRATWGLLAPPSVPLSAEGLAAAGISPAAVAPLTREEHHYHFGTFNHFDPTEAPPKLVFLRSGIRSGKTYLAAIGVIKSALSCSVRRPLTEAEIAAGSKPDADGMVHALQQGESIRVVFCTPKAEQSKKAFDYVMGAFLASPRLKALVVKQTTEILHIRRPHDGVIVEFVMVAASPRGNNVRSGWLAGAIFDESAFFDDGDSAAVNLRDNVTAAVSRLLPGAQIWLPSSPWSDEGYWHEKHAEAQKRAAESGPATDAIAFHSSSRALNPALPKGQEETVSDPMERAREYDAQPVNAGSNTFFGRDILLRCVNDARTAESGRVILSPIAGVPHYAGTDLAFRENSSTLAIARNTQRPREGSRVPVDVVELAYTEELIPPKGRPLVPSEVIHAFGRTCQAYGCATMRGDYHAIDTAVEQLAKMSGPTVAYDAWAPTPDKIVAAFSRVRELMSEGRVDLPNDPRLLSQFKCVLGKALTGGRFQIILPRQGRAHTDLVVAAVHAIAQAADGAGSVLTYDTTYDRYATLGLTDRVLPRTADRDDGRDGRGGEWGGGSDRALDDF